MKLTNISIYPDPTPEKNRQHQFDMTVDMGRAARRLGQGRDKCPPFRDEDLRISWHIGWRTEDEKMQEQPLKEIDIINSASAQALQRVVDGIIEEIRPDRMLIHDAVNWSDLRCTDVLASLIHPNGVIVIIEEASPEARVFQEQVTKRLRQKGLKTVTVQTEW